MRRIIGVTGQDATLDELLTGAQNLVLVGELSNLSRRDARARAADLLEHFELTDAGDRMVKTYSGGMRRRLDLAASLVGRPPVLFLDEPTTGLDPTSRLRMWGVIRGLVADGTTLLLTTQYLDEADALADEISVIDHGRVIAHGTPHELKARVGGQRLEVVLSAPHPDAAAAPGGGRRGGWTHGSGGSGCASGAGRGRRSSVAGAGRRATGPRHRGGARVRRAGHRGRRRHDPPPVARRRVLQPHRSARRRRRDWRVHRRVRGRCVTLRPILERPALERPALERQGAVVPS